MADLLLGKLVWYELMTNDLQGAEAFYTSIIGWTPRSFDAGEPYRVMSDAAGKSVGGIIPMPDGVNVPPNWVMYIGTPDIDATIAQIERLGGSGVAPLQEMPNVGRIRTMRDPQGATFALIQPSSPERRPDAQPGLGDGAWHELYTTNGEAAIRFYSEVFGWQQTSEFDMGPTGKYYMFGRDFPLGGMMTKPNDQTPTAWGIYFRVLDVDAAAGQVASKGGTVINGPMDVPGGDRIVQCVDPQGAMFALHHPAPVASGV